ncbi:MAG: PRTRC system protein B [Methylococcales bacterium]|nr:PRTRC system protein B [Methylobacter sp.]MDZ4154979.1 PRTRC system protein B [Methylococcales bacterium]MDP2097499.1 PRTRC system protein B [Methylobacter sp.]MDP2426690.1 PRTRC system protein B [Methylobacter sp.]MDP3055357.1 PRTRC system protein B [Methylobacter sp.]
MKPNDFFQFCQDEKPSIVQKHAILIHQAKAISGGYSPYRADDFLASMHDFVTNGQGESVIGAGRLMSKEDVESVLRSMLAMGKRKVSLLPPNAVSISETHLAWTVPAQVRPMLFNITGLPMKKIDVPWPRLLMVANRNGKLAVAALKNKGRVNGKTRLYHAPLMNVYANGNVCTGSATLPDEYGIDQIKAWEAVMFDSAFSHVNNPSTLSLAGDKDKTVDNKAHYRFWLSLSKKKVAKFPAEHLSPLRYGVEDFIENHS